MFCWNCGAEISDYASFCPECGSEVAQQNQVEDIPNQNAKSGKSGIGRATIKLFGFVFSIAIIIFLIAMIAAFVQGLAGVPYSDSDNSDNSGLSEDYYTTQPTQIPNTPTPIQTQKTPAPTQTPTPTPRPTDSVNYYYRNFDWSYGNSEWTYSLGIAKDTYDYYRNKPHNRESDYSQYALSDYDRTYIQGIVTKFNEAGREEGYDEYDDVMMIVSFVQSLPYTSDSVTTGYDEYPRYPLETLVDYGGDCEDSAILTAALIREMGYGAVLIQLPGHMAVGVKCSDNFYGTYYEYQGSRYYYLETTGQGWDIGEIPDVYKSETAQIHPMIQIPRMSMSMNAEYEDYDYNYVYYRIHCDIENIGSGTANSPVVYFAALAPTEGSDKVWDQEMVELEDYGEGATGWAEATVSIPRDSVSQISCTLFGSNFEPVEIYSDTFST